MGAARVITVFGPWLSHSHEAIGKAADIYIYIYKRGHFIMSTYLLYFAIWRNTRRIGVMIAHAAWNRKNGFRRHGHSTHSGIVDFIMQSLGILISSLLALIAAIYDNGSRVTVTRKEACEHPNKGTYVHPICPYMQIYIYIYTLIFAYIYSQILLYVLLLWVFSGSEFWAPRRWYTHNTSRTMTRVELCVTWPPVRIPYGGILINTIDPLAYNTKALW